MITYLLVALVAVAALAGAGAYLYLRNRQGEDPRKAFDYFQCPKCKQRLRYLPKQSGHSGQCPRCKKSITFPR